MKTKLTRIRMRVISLLLVISMMVVSYSGCWSRVEIEKMSFISVVGVDRAGSDLLVSFQIVNPSALAKNGGTGGGGGEPPVFVLSVKGRTLPDALAKISQESPRAVRFKQLDAVVLGESLGKEGVSHIMDFFARHWEMRRSIWIIVAKGSAQEILLKGAPVQEKVPGMAIKMLMDRRDRLAPTHYPIKLGDFLNGMSMEGTDAIASAVSVEPMQEKIAGESVEDKDEDGNKAAAEKKEIVFEGAGVFRGAKLVGYLGPHEARGVLWVSGKIQGGIYTVPPPSQGTLGSLVTEKSSVRVKPVISKDNIRFQISIYDEGYV
jgi:spore germination protein KC